VILTKRLFHEKGIDQGWLVKVVDYDVE